MTINYSLSDQVSQKGWIENERNQKKRIVGRNHAAGGLCLVDCFDPAFVKELDFVIP
jgi:hypothetical protein